jgi:hypothetical protein
MMLMSYQYILYEKKGHIAYVTINRPEVMNALHYDTNVELSAAFDDFKQGSAAPAGFRGFCRRSQGVHGEAQAPVEGPLVRRRRLRR